MKDKVERILNKNSIEPEEVQSKEDNPTESRENHYIKTSDRNYYLSFMNERRKGPLYIYDKLSHKIKAETYSFQQFRNKLDLDCPEVIDTDYETYILFTEINGSRTVSEFDKETPEKNRRLAKKLGRVLGKIHSLEYDTSGFFDRGDIESINWVQRMESFLPHIEDLAEKEYDRKGLKILKENKELVQRSSEPHHLHGDFHPFNTISTDEGIAVIDAEDSMAGPKEWDIGKTLGFWAIKFNVRDSFLEGYLEKQELERNWERRVRYYIILQILIGTLRAKKAGWESLHEDHYPTLKKEVEKFN